MTFLVWRIEGVPQNVCPFCLKIVMTLPVWRIEGVPQIVCPFCLKITTKRHTSSPYFHLMSLFRCSVEICYYPSKNPLRNDGAILTGEIARYFQRRRIPVLPCRAVAILGVLRVRHPPPPPGQISVGKSSKSYSQSAN